MNAVTGVRELDVGLGPAAMPRQLVRLLEREWLLIVLAAFVTGAFAVACRLWFTSDSWYSVAYGREILHHGLPHTDTMTVMGHGRAWVDQQWLGHILLYGLYALGGAKLTSLASAILFSATFVALLILARRRGASGPALVVVGLFAWLYMSTYVQVEVFSRPLFLALLVLLAAESRRRSRRVLLAFPLLVLWANLHGAVVLGAALVALLGAVEFGQLALAKSATRAAVARAAALAFVPWACILATPYGLSILHYYRLTIFSSAFHQYLGPWMPPIPFSIIGGPFFVLTLISAAVVARRYRRLTAFELAALAVTLFAAVETRRSIPWFAVACVLFLPAALQREHEGSWRVRWPRLPFAASVFASVSAVAALAQASVQPQSYYTAAYFDDRAAAFVADYAKDHPGAKIWANDPFGDWLAYVQPSLWGKVAYDARWEQLTPRQLETLHTFLYRLGPDWKAPLRGYGLLLMSRHMYTWLLDPLERDPRFRVVYRDSDSVVLEPVARATRP
jgi:hypothetical protein